MNKYVQTYSALQANLLYIFRIRRAIKHYKKRKIWTKVRGENVVK